MSVNWKIESGNLAVIRVSGKLRGDKYMATQKEIETEIQKLGTIKMLILLENFSGWEGSKGWEDESFSERNDPYIEKIAIVGDPEWEALVEVFTLKGLRPVPIEYFNTGDESNARQWLDG